MADPQGMKLEALDMQEGAENNVRRLLPQRRMPSFDPFAQMDDYWITPPAGFPPHPHHGFEAVIYVLEGALHHADTLGNDAVVSAGDVLTFCAGRGLNHSELPVSEGRTHAVQLWIALPRADKQCEPSAQHVVADQLTDVDVAGGQGRIIAGPESPLTLQRNLHLHDFQLDKRRQLTVQVEAGHRGFVYVLSGRLDTSGERLDAGQALLFDGLTELSVQARKTARFLIATAPPIDEPIRQWGSYVS